MVPATLLEDNMRNRISTLVLLLLLPLTATAELYVTVIQGLDGDPEYGKQFTSQVEKLMTASESVADEQRVHLFSGVEANRDNILKYFEQLATTTKAEDRLAVFMVGHGSFDGYEYKFNIPGPDLTDADLVSVMQAQPAKLQIVVNTSSSSGVLQQLLKADSRTVITATRNGEERLATRFGAYFANALEDPAADTNKNKAVSLQEAYDYASRMVKDYFETQGQLATEHAVMSGEQAGQFVLARAGAALPQGTDPELVELVNRREQLDVSIEQLQLRKAELPVEEYMNQLQHLMIDLSVVQDMIDRKEGSGGQ